MARVKVVSTHEVSEVIVQRRGERVVIIITGIGGLEISAREALKVAEALVDAADQ